MATAAGFLRSLIVYHGQPWRRRSIRRLYRTLLPDNALAFDIGAHVGSRTATLLSLGAHCVAVEPQPAFRDWLRRRYGGHPRVQLVAAAVGERAGTATLHVSRRHPTVSTLSRPWIDAVTADRSFDGVHWDLDVDVDVTTLDALIEQHGVPDFCKIDVEGLEAEILAGLSHPLPLVAFEFLPAAMPIAEACLDRLISLGEYRFSFTLGERHHLWFDDWVDVETLRRSLQRVSANGESGDIYARHVAARSATGTRAPGSVPTSDSRP